MKVLVFGPSGSGKTYVSRALRDMGINAFDDGDIDGLSNWYNMEGKKVPPPQTAEEVANNQYAFLWSKKFLARFTGQFTDVYIFGGSGNIANVFDLFDKVYFLKVTPELQRERILNGTRKDAALDTDENGIVIWGDWFEELAIQKNIPFVNADQTPQEIFDIISK
jgi:hypothetical protein